MKGAGKAVLGTVAVAAAVAAACSGQDGDPVGSAEEGSPLAEYVGSTAGYSGVGFGTPFGQGTEVPWSSDEQREQQRRFEEAVAECMAEEGFEYVPALGDDQLRAYEEAAALPTEEFVKQHGYGFTFGYLDSGGESTRDPNQEIREALSPGARDAYDAAMWGDAVEVIDAGGTTVLRQVPSDEAPRSAEDARGCQQQARKDVYGSETPTVGEIPFRTLLDDIFQLYQRVEDDPEVAEAARAWSECMADAGYPGFEAVADARRSVLERLSDLVLGPAAPPGGDGDENPADAGGGAAGAAGGVAGGDGAATVDSEKLEQLHEQEVAQAAVDYACQQEHYLDVYREVAHELEAEFVEQHRDELERYRAFLRGEGDESLEP